MFEQGQTPLNNLAEMKVVGNENRRRREDLNKGTDHSSLPYVSGANETDRMQKRGADEFAFVSVCVNLEVCTCVCLRRRGLQRGSLKEDSEGMKHRSIGGPLRLSIFPHKHQTPPYHQSDSAIAYESHLPTHSSSPEELLFTRM